MKTYYVKDLEVGQVIDSETFAIQQLKRAEDKNSRPYYDLKLGDKSGTITAKIWTNQIPNVDKQALKQGRIVSITAKVEEFRGKRQVNIHRLTGVDESVIEEYIEASAFNPDEMWAELMQIVDKVEDQYLSKFLENLLADEDVAHALKYLPAGVYVHHGFRSGLLQHVLEILGITDSLRRYYPEINYDLIVVGAILHDLGKMQEFDVEGAAVKFSLSGVMVGHLVMSYEMIDRYAPEEMPDLLKLKLKNMVLSHHGKREHGAPVEPATIESQLLASADDLVFKVGAYHRIINENKENDEEMSDYDRILDRRIYVGD